MSERDVEALRLERWNIPYYRREAFDAALAHLTADRERLVAAIEAARRELARASVVRVNRTGIIGNTDLILQRALTPQADAAGGCPKGDDCALNKGAVSCFHCGRNWPPDETWVRADAAEGER